MKQLKIINHNWDVPTTIKAHINTWASNMNFDNKFDGLYNIFDGLSYYCREVQVLGDKNNLVEIYMTELIDENPFNPWDEPITHQHNFKFTWSYDQSFTTYELDFALERMVMNRINPEPEYLDIAE